MRYVPEYQCASRSPHIDRQDKPAFALRATAGSLAAPLRSGRRLERVNGIAPLSRPWHGRILLLNHTRKNGVPSRTLTDNLTLRTRPLCALSYGDKRSNPWPVSFTGSHPALSG